MATILLLEDCYDAESACNKVKADIDSTAITKLAQVHNFLAYKTDDYFDKAFSVGGFNPLKKKRDEIVLEIEELEKLNERYRDILKQRFWAYRLRDLQTYREYLTSEISKYTNKQDKLLKSMQKESNYQGIQSSTRYSDYLQLKNEMSDFKERLELCEKEIDKARSKVSSLGSAIAGGY